MANYIPIGEPINEAEVRGIRALRDALPSHFTVIGNFELHIPNRANTFEFDAVVIGEHCVYTVEIKGWSGRIGSDGRQWHLEWGRVENPFLRLESKTKALRGFLQTQIPGFPEDLFCRSFVFLPRDVVLEFTTPDDRILTGETDIHEAFVDRSMIEEMGPGPLLQPHLRAKVEGALLPAIVPNSYAVVVSDYEIEAELETPHRLYREFVGRHKLLASRNRVRIKRYDLDPLLSRSERQSAFDRVLREMEAITMLDTNPYIARGFDVIRDRDEELNFYLVSEWVGARTLQDVASSTQPIFDEALHLTRRRLAAYLLQAVDFMHKKGIVHRNLSLEVIYVTDDPLVPLKITDFEYARIDDLPSIVGNFSDVGTAGFIAPELWKSQDHDHRVDIFSCGAILFELLTGAPLFESLKGLVDPAATWYVKSQMVEDPKLRDAIGACLKPNPDERPDDLHSMSRIFTSRTIEH